jgi:hypothetical protein
MRCGGFYYWVATLILQHLLKHCSRKKPKPQSHLELFFAGYPRFRYDPTAPVSAQYDALCRLYGFFRPKVERGTMKSERDTAREVAYAGFQRAMARTFAEIFGTDVNDLGNWQSLCRVLEVDPIPQTLWACRAVGIEYSPFLNSG